MAYLSRHDFCVGARDVDAGVEAGPVVRLHDVAPVHLKGEERSNREGQK